MLNIYFSNNLEYLLSKFHSKLLPTLSPIKIITQTDGMKKWISINTAKKKGIFTNFRFFTPLEFIFKLFEQAGISNNFYKKDFLFFLIAKLINEKEFSVKEINDYLKSGNYFLRLAQISYLLADLIEQYLVYRQPMIAKWENNELYYKKSNLELWQKDLYLKIKNHIKEKPFTLKFDKILNLPIEKLKNFSPIYIFGISVLPKLFVKFFIDLANIIEVNFFLLNPCKEFWYYDLPNKNLLKKENNKKLYLEEGNPLLSSLGNLGKNFFSYLINYNFKEKYFEYPENTCLNLIKNDILNRKENFIKKNISDTNSIQIHICHSPLREIEVLYDNILKFLKEDNSLKLEDILVMTPDINIYIPYIKSIFKNIPYNISDINPIKTSQFVKIFFQILKINKTKFEVSEILDILEFDCIKQKFNIAENEIEIIRELIRKANIKWGIDKKFKEKFFKNHEEFLNFNTWDFGIKRIMYGLMAYEEKCINNILPLSELDFSLSETISKLTKFIDIIAKFYDITQKEYKLDEWVKIISNLIDDIFSINIDYEIPYRKVLDAISSLKKNCITNFKVKIDFIIEFLNKKLFDSISSSRFISGGITFAEMIPMRSIPFKIIYLIGLNDETFPRQKRQLNFDLMYKFPELGDRNIRDNDKYLFLETILSAKEKFYISYVGYNMKDNKLLPPSILVNELIDYLDKRISINGKKPSEMLTFHHKLHPFNPEYFKKKSKLFSFSKENFDAANIQINSKNPIQSINKIVLNTSKKDIDPIISIEDLYSFFSNPVKYFFTNILEIRIIPVENADDDNEPLFIPPLQKYKIREEIFENLFYEKPIDEILEKTKYKGLLPYGISGKIAIKQIELEANKLKQKILNKFNLKKTTTQSIEYKFEDFIIIGEISNFNFLEKEYYYIRPSKLNPIDFLKATLDHLLISFFLGSEITTYLIGIENKFYEIKDFYDVNYFKQLMNIYLKGFKELIKFDPPYSYTIAGKDKFSHPDERYLNNYIDNYLKFLLYKNFNFYDTEFKQYSDTIFIPIKNSMSEFIFD